MGGKLNHNHTMPVRADQPGVPIGTNDNTDDAVQVWLEELHDGQAVPALHALGALLVGVVERVGGGHEKAETVEQFTARCLGKSMRTLLNEERTLGAISALTTAVVLQEWIDRHSPQCQIGPGGRFVDAPRWTQTRVGDQKLHHPLNLRAYFPAGTLLQQTGLIIFIDAQGEGTLFPPRVSVLTPPEHQQAANDLLETLMERGNEINPYRGKILRAASVSGRLALKLIELPRAATRTSVIVPEAVWTEVDLAVRSVRDRHEILNIHGLGSRRGVLLCGPPGTGKSAVSAVIARELAGEFTIVYVEPKAGALALTSIVQEVQQIGGPVMMVLEDVDLWVRDRSSGGPGLAELLQAMEINPDARILTFASTNDAAALDKAAIRAGRFDSVIQIDYPTRTDAARILTALIAGIADPHSVDVQQVAAALPQGSSGADLREIVRRTIVVEADDTITTQKLLDEIGAGRYRAPMSHGTYL
ncbi:cell division protease ftsH-like protein [Mycobacteroides abscessus subsp. abscessus]|nr:cell division protease ftsH-like protein [Mycobacteroides abscessus subsp. abscessus]